MLPADRDRPDLDTGGREPAAGKLREAWRSAADWRRSRPFWGGVFLVAAGAELLLIPLPDRKSVV